MKLLNKNKNDNFNKRHLPIKYKSKRRSFFILKKIQHSLLLKEKKIYVFFSNKFNWYSLYIFVIIIIVSVILGLSNSFLEKHKSTNIIPTNSTNKNNISNLAPAKRTNGEVNKIEGPIYMASSIRVFTYLNFTIYIDNGKVDNKEYDERTHYSKSEPDDFALPAVHMQNLKDDQHEYLNVNYDLIYKFKFKVEGAANPTFSITYPNFYLLNENLIKQNFVYLIYAIGSNVGNWTILICAIWIDENNPYIDSINYKNNGITIESLNLNPRKMDTFLDQLNLYRSNKFIRCIEAFHS